MNNKSSFVWLIILLKFVLAQMVGAEDRDNCRMRVCRCSQSADMYCRVDCRYHNFRKTPDQIPLVASAIRLSHNIITKISREDLRYLVILQRLDFSWNTLQTIEDYSFESLFSLKELDLSTNLIRKVGKNTFLSLQNLMKLNLDRNELRVLPDDVFYYCSRLKSLCLARNQLSELSTNALQCLRSLETIDLYGNKFHVIGESSFSSFLKLEDMDLSQNLIAKVEDKTFWKLQNLRKLDLCNNELGSLPNYVFGYLSNLTYLNLNKNKLTGLPEGVFQNLSSLTSLELSGNDFKMIPSGVFRHLLYLEKLQLGGNQIQELNNESFRYLLNLCKLNVSANRLEILGENVFNNQYILKVLNLSHNNIYKIERNAFRHLFNLGELYLQYNQINTMPKNLFSSLVSLYYLNLGYNNINILWEHTFRGLPDLEMLQLDGNKLSHLNGDTFKILQKLIILDLNSNKLKTVRSNTFVNLPSLKQLYLKRNYIEELQCRGVADLKRIRKIDLAFNRITKIPPEFFAEFELTLLDISNNHLKTISKEALHINKRHGTNLLSIASNKISSVPSDLLSRVNIFATLDMSNNRLSELPPLLFDSSNQSHEMDTLLLARNRLTYIPKYAFRGLKNLKSLCLFFNKIKELDNRAFSETSVENIYLFGNKLLELSNTSFDNQGVKEVHLYGNPDIRIKRSAFKNVKQTVTLYLSCNDVQEIERMTAKVQCVTPLYSPAIKVPKDVEVSLKSDGFTCNNTHCTPCPRGTFGGEHMTCDACPPGGFYQDEIGSTSGQSRIIACKRCPNGTYAKTSGATSRTQCIVCPDGTDRSRHAGFRACHCLINYTRNDRFGPCFPCKEDGYNCSGYDYTLLKPGFFWSWNFATANLSLYKRFVNNLNNTTRQSITSTTDTQYLLEIPQVFQCIRRKSCTNNLGDIEGTCAAGYRGWLCSKCEKNFYKVLTNCLPCPSLWYLVIELAVMLFIVIAVILIIFRQYKSSYKCRPTMQTRTIFDVIISRGKIVLGFSQTIGEFLISFHEINWTGKMYIVGEAILIIEMNVLRLFVKPQCFNENWVINPKIEFIISVSFVVILILTAFCFYKFYVACLSFKHPLLKGDGVADRHSLLASKVFGVVTVLLFITYPPICTTVFQLYPRACRTFCLDTKKEHCIKLLRTDFEIKCNDIVPYHITAYMATVGYVIAFPTVLFYLLWKKFRKPHKFNENVAFVETYDKNDVSWKNKVCLSDTPQMTIWMKFLCENYKPQYWYWEIVELVRKVTQTVLITLLGWDNKLTVLLTICISVLFIILHAKYLPMKSKLEQGLQMLSLVAILINVLLSAMGAATKYDDSFSVALLLLNVAVLIIIIGEMLLGLLLHLKKVFIS